MATLDDIVSVDIHLNTSGVGRANFGTILFFSNESHAVRSRQAALKGTVQTYNRLSDVAGDVDASSTTYAALAAAFGQSPRPRSVKVLFSPIDGPWVSAPILAGAIQKDAGWYVAIVPTASGGDMAAFAKAIEGERRLLIAESGQYAADAAKTANLYRTAVIHGDGSGATAAAWAAKCLGYAAGSETWALKKLAGVPATALPASDENTLLNNNGSIYSRLSSDVNLTRGGKVAGGEWIDVIRFRDWLQDVMQTNLVATLINRPKLPYTDEGLAVIESSMIKSLEEGVRAGGVVDWRDNGEGQLVRGYTVTVPRAADVPFNIKASRVAHVSFSAYLTGAIHAIEVTGSFTYEGAL